MNILIAIASRHGSTEGIAEVLAHELRAAGHTVTVRAADDPADVPPYDAAIIGSAIYAGNWLPAATAFVEDEQVRLAAVPVWLFSSGPLGAEDPPPPGEPKQLADVQAATGAREHSIFAGKLDKHDLNLAERLITHVVGAPEGDFRDWEAIRAWAREIAAALPVPAPAAA